MNSSAFFVPTISRWDRKWKSRHAGRHSRCSKTTGTASIRSRTGQEARSRALPADRDPALYENVLDRYLRSGNRLKLGPPALVNKLVQGSGPERAYEIISEADYHARNSWLFRYCAAIPADFATPDQLERLYEL